MDGIIGLAVAGEHTIRVTFDESKIDPQKITNALLRGGVAIPGNQGAVPEVPFSYQ